MVEGAGIVGQVLGALEIGGLDDLSVNVEQELQNQGVAKGDISSAYLVEITLSTPDGDDLSFLDSLALTISSPGLDTARIAHAEDFPEGETSVTLTLDGVDLTEYLLAESLTIATDASGELPADDTTIEVYLALDVEATVQGACNAAERAE